MTDSNNPLRLCIMSPNGTLLDTVASSVRLAAVDGSRGVRRGHPTALVLLARGKLEYVKDGVTHSFDANGVFAEIKNDTVTVIAE